MADIRCNSWLNSDSNLSWGYVMERLLRAWEKLGHNIYAVSTNGLGEGSAFTQEEMSRHFLELEKFGPGQKQIDLDITYTVPINFPKRFLANSKYKAVIYNFETTLWNVAQWKPYYNIPDFYFPSSNFSAEIFVRNGISPEKTFVIPHGIDTSVFNSSVPPVKLKTQKKFKFCCVAAPHARKNLPTLLNAYCQAFTKQDDVCLVLKTKIYKHSDGWFDAEKNPKGRKPFEIVIGDVFRELSQKYGDRMPEIELITNRVENVASIYNSCDAHVTSTGSEGFGLPVLEAMGSGLINIVPNYSGLCDFTNKDNCLLVDTKMRYAKREEQYWHFDPKAKIGQVVESSLIEALLKAYNEHTSLKEKFAPAMKQMVKDLSWENAAQKILDVCEKKVEHYKPGTYNKWGSNG